ncbi:hypothetical protein ABH925_006808 [Streptacidiphilus sp. EB129]
MYSSTSSTRRALSQMSTSASSTSACREMVIGALDGGPAT